MRAFKGLFDRGKVSHEKFADLAVRALVARRIPRDRIEYDERAFALRYGTATSYLANVYMSYLRADDRAERAALLERWAHAMAVDVGAALPASFEEARGALLPVIRAVEEAWYPTLTGVAAAAFVDRPFPDPDLVVSVAYDREYTLTRVPASALATWNVSPHDLWTAAFHNLRLRSADAWESMGGGIFLARWSDAYDASRVLLPDVMHRTAAAGRPLVMIPTRDRLLVIGEREPSALERLVEIGHAFYDEDPYARSPLPFVYEGERLELASLPPHLAVACGRRRLSRRAQLYSAQADANQERYGDVFFATLMVLEANDGSSLRSLATWGNGVDTLLPKAGLISFGVTQDDGFVVRWDDAVAILGPLTQDEKLQPPRYRVTAFPGDAQLARLRAAAVDVNAIPEPVSM